MITRKKKQFLKIKRLNKKEAEKRLKRLGQEEMTVAEVKVLLDKVKFFSN